MPVRDWFACNRIAAHELPDIYNAKSGIAQKPELESQVTIFKDGKECYKGKLETVDLTGKDLLKGIPVVKGLVFDSMEEGEYLLQLAVTDNQAKGKSSTAIQSVDFEIQKSSLER